MASNPILTNQIIQSILHYLDSLNMKESARTLERESGLFFNVRYFEELLLHGEFEEAETYLEGFTSVHDNIYSTRMFFEIRKQNFLEALDEGNKQKAIRLLSEDLKDFEQYGNQFLSDAAQLLTLDNIRMHQMMAGYGDTVTERRVMMGQMRRYLEGNPALHGKLVIPNMACLISAGSSGTESLGTASPEINNFRLFDGFRAGSPINLNDDAHVDLTASDQLFPEAGAGDGANRAA